MKLKISNEIALKVPATMNVGRRPVRLIATALVLFALVTTTHFWWPDFGLYAFPAFLLLALAYLFLGVAFLNQLFHAIKEKFHVKTRNWTVGIVGAALLLILLFPDGLVSHIIMQREVLLHAERKGAANCMTTFKIIERGEFSESSICFGASALSGEYIQKGDTLFFSNMALSRHSEAYYQYAVIELDTTGWERYIGKLVMYENSSDTAGKYLYLSTNELNASATD